MGRLVRINSANKSATLGRVTAKRRYPAALSVVAAPPASAVPERSRDESTRDCGGSRRGFRSVLGGSHHTRGCTGGSMCWRWGKPRVLPGMSALGGGIWHSDASSCYEAAAPRPVQTSPSSLPVPAPEVSLRRSPAAAADPTGRPPSPPPPSTIPVQSPKIDPLAPGTPRNASLVTPPKGLDAPRRRWRPPRPHRRRGLTPPPREAADAGELRPAGAERRRCATAATLTS